RERWQDAQQQMSERLPRAARAIHTVKSPRDLIEKNLRLLAPAGEDSLKIDLVAAMLRQFLRAANRELDEFARDGVGLRIEPVKRPLPLPPRAHQVAIRQQPEVRRDAR